MMLLKNRLVNSIIITMISLFYGILFILISGHMEFIRTIPTSMANYAFWDEWRIFLLTDNVRYIGISTIFVGLIILLRTIYTSVKFKRVELDEYEVSILKKGMGIAGITTILLMPILITLVLSEPQYAVPYIIFFAVLTWSLFALTSLYFVFKY